MHLLKKRLFMLQLLPAICFSGLCSAQSLNWKYDAQVHGIYFSKFRYEIKGSDTLAIVGYLKEEQEIERYCCAADWVQFSKDWKLVLFKLAQDEIVDHIEYPKDTWIRIRFDSGTICLFGSDTTVSDTAFLCQINQGASIRPEFYESGQIRFFYAENDIEINHIKCKGGLSGIGLYEDGHLMECTLSADQTIQQTNYKKGDRIFIDEMGKISLTGH